MRLSLWLLIVSVLYLAAVVYSAPPSKPTPPQQVKYVTVSNYGGYVNTDTYHIDRINRITRYDSLAVSGPHYITKYTYLRFYNLNKEYYFTSKECRVSKMFADSWLDPFWEMCVSYWDGHRTLPDGRQCENWKRTWYDVGVRHDKWTCWDGNQMAWWTNGYLGIEFNVTLWEPYLDSHAFDLPAICA